MWSLFYVFWENFSLYYEIGIVKIPFLIRISEPFDSEFSKLQPGKIMIIDKND